MQTPLFVPPLPDFLKLLAHDVRWQLVSALADSDRRVHELVALLQRPQNLVSYHLRLLRQGRLVQERRSSADGRDVYYSLDLEQVRRLYCSSGQALHPALACAAAAAPAGADAPDTAETAVSRQPRRPVRVLFLCTHNSARSQLAQGILRASGGERVAVCSAGSDPTAVHPLAVRAAAALGLDISAQQATHLDAFTGQTFDYIITVCDRVRETCPVFPDDPRQIHWSFPDPAAVTGGEEAQFQAFLQTAREVATRIHYLLLQLDRRQQEGA